MKTITLKSTDNCYIEFWEICIDVDLWVQGYRAQNGLKTNAEHHASITAKVNLKSLKFPLVNPSKFRSEGKIPNNILLLMEDINENNINDEAKDGNSNFRSQITVSVRRTPYFPKTQDCLILSHEKIYRREDAENICAMA